MEQYDPYARIEQVFNFDIPARQKPVRLDVFITNAIEHATRSRVQKAISDGAVTVNGQIEKASYVLKPGDAIRVTTHRPPPLMLVPQEIPLTVLYEDDYLMVIDKQAGLLAHPGVGNRTGTLVNAVLWHLGQREAVELDGDDADGDDDSVAFQDEAIMKSDAVRPGIVHRLDRDTTGVVVIGKEYETTHQLTKQFAERTVEREYVALVWGVVGADHDTITGNIATSTRNHKLKAVTVRGGKEAKTEFTVLERYRCASFLRVKLHTGRTHQIRVHMSSKRHPVVGDPDYGGREAVLPTIHHAYRREAQLALGAIQRQALHARSLGFTHPRTGERLRFETTVPADMQAAIDTLRIAALDDALAG
jgi:23S rRNA pseudouridine1911/1915/1917 synthase